MNFRMPHLPFMNKPMSPHTMVILSETGNRAANALNETGMNFVIISKLAEHGGSMTVIQIARACGINSIDETRQRLQDLKRAGYVRFSGEEQSYPMEDY